MGPIETNMLLFSLIVLIGQVFQKSRMPISLMLIICGMILSLLPLFPTVKLNSEHVLNIFLPLLIYDISSSSSWKNVKSNMRPILLMSFGHVVFITVLVAIVMHRISPELSWPLAFVLGTVLAPPDDVAIVDIAKNAFMPERIFSILEGEALFNDAAALILFRFALIAVLTNAFSPTHVFTTFLFVLIGESIYGYVLGTVLGEVRLRIKNPTLHMIASALTPFLAYIPAVNLGGCGVLATAITGFMIGNRYSPKFSSEFRLLSRAIWPTVTFAIQCVLFLLVGLNLHSIMGDISTIAPSTLVFYAVTVIFTLMIGRFIWVFVGVYFLPRALFPSLRKRDPYPPWQYPFIVSWAGIRGSISLAAALAVPALPTLASGTNPRNLLVFLVFTSIVVTFILQGMTLPLLINWLGIKKHGLAEKHQEHMSELNARVKMVAEVLRWLRQYQREVDGNPRLATEVNEHIKQYKIIKAHLKDRIAMHAPEQPHDENAETLEEYFLTAQIIEIEKAKVVELYRANKINLTIRNRLLEKLDHRAKAFPGSIVRQG